MADSLPAKYQWLNKQLGKGQYGTAWVVCVKASGEELVLKRMNTKQVRIQSTMTDFI